MQIGWHVDEVIAKISRLTFLAHPVVYITNGYTSQDV